jgi:hypothetical protein
MAQQLYPGVELDWLDKHRLAMNATSSQTMHNRQQLAMQLAQQEETARQHDAGILREAMGNPRAQQMLEALSQDPKFRFAKQAGQLKRSLKDADYGSLKAYQEFLPPEIKQKFINGQLQDYEVTSWLDTAREATKVNGKEAAKAQIIKTAMDKPVDKRTPYEQQLVDEREEGLKDKEAKRFRDQAAAYKDLQSLNGGDNKDHSVLNRVHMSQNHGQPYEQGNEASQKAALKEYSRMNAEGRVSVQMATPAPVKERTNIIDRKEFLKTGKLVLPQRGVTEGQLRSGDFTEISDKQKEAWGEIENSGQTLNALFGMVEPLITAKTPAQALKQYAALSVGAVSKKNAAAATYMADSEAFSSRMARVFGSEVGVLTQGDVDRWKRALPTFGDTVDVKNQKKKVFLDIYKQSRAMAMKKIAGEDITEDLNKLRSGPLAEAVKINPPSIDEDFDVLMRGGK